MGKMAVKFARCSDVVFLVKNRFGLRHAIRGAGPAADLLVYEGLLGPMATRETVYQALKEQGFAQTYDEQDDFLGQVEAMPLTKRQLVRAKKKPAKGKGDA